MASGGAFGGAKGAAPRPPEKGIFPLDHFGECKAAKEAYVACLREHKSQAEACTELSKRYLKCRMEKSLMAKQDLGELGMQQEKSAAASADRQTSGSESSRRESTGFVAGFRSQ